MSREQPAPLWCPAPLAFPHIAHVNCLARSAMPQHASHPASARCHPPRPRCRAPPGRAHGRRGRMQWPPAVCGGNQARGKCKSLGRVRRRCQALGCFMHARVPQSCTHAMHSSASQHAPAPLHRWAGPQAHTPQPPAAWRLRAARSPGVAPEKVERHSSLGCIKHGSTQAAHSGQ